MAFFTSCSEFDELGNCRPSVPYLLGDLLLRVAGHSQRNRRVQEVQKNRSNEGLSDFSELAGMLEPLHRELGELDAAIAGALLVRDLAWRGSRPCVTAGDRVVVVDEGSAGRLASAVAETAGQGLPLAA